MTKIVSIGTKAEYSNSKVSDYQSQSGIPTAYAKENLYVGDGSKKANITNISKNSVFLTEDEDVELVSAGDDVTFKNGSGNVNIIATGNNVNIDMSENENDSKIYFSGSNSTIKTGSGSDYLVASGSNLNIDQGDGNNYLKTAKLDIEFSKGQFDIKLYDTIVAQVINENILKAISEAEEPDPKDLLPESTEEYDDNGNLINLIQYGFDENGKIYTETYNYTYNSNNYVTKSVYELDNESDGVADYREIGSFEYDSADNLISKLYKFDWNADNVIDATAKNVYYYNNNGDITRDVFDYDGDNDSKTDYQSFTQYHYDANNNLEKVYIEIDENGDGEIDSVETLDELTVLEN